MSSEALRTLRWDGGTGVWCASSSAALLRWPSECCHVLSFPGVHESAPVHGGSVSVMFGCHSYPLSPLPRAPMPTPADRTRSSSMPPPKERPQDKKGRSRAASVEGRELEKAGKLADADRGCQGGGDARLCTLAALHRRVGRCILLLARFVDRGKEEEKSAAAGTYRLLARRIWRCSRVILGCAS